MQQIAVFWCLVVVYVLLQELSITRQQTMWNLASMFSVTLLGVYIALDENLVLPKEKHSAFVWRHDYVSQHAICRGIMTASDLCWRVLLTSAGVCF